jgi:hypothetical protein
MTGDEQKIYDLLLDKSKEAFICAIEIYNKPTIQYRIEGFSFFICNAWELMLKAHLISKNGLDSIFYKDNPERTIAFSDAISKIFTNTKAPINLNLERMIDLRNTSTHFIIPEYEMIYLPLFQSCIFNFNTSMLKFHNINMEDYIPLNFLQLSVKMKPIQEDEVKVKYPGILGEKFLKQEEQINKEIDEYNDNFAIKIIHELYITKKKERADSIVKLDENADNNAYIITKLKDPNLTHKLTAMKVVEKVNEKIMKKGLKPEFTKNKFQLFIKFFNLKEQEEYCFVNSIYQNDTYSYSQKTVDFIVDLIHKNPDNIYETLKEKLRRTNK